MHRAYGLSLLVAGMSLLVNRKERELLFGFTEGLVLRYRMNEQNFPWPTVLAAGRLAKVFVDFCSCYFHSSSAAAECGKRGRSVYKGYGDWPVLGHGHGRAFIRLSKYEADACRLSQGLRFPEVLLRGRCK